MILIKHQEKFLNSLWTHLDHTRYNCMHLRRPLKKGILLGAFKKEGNSIRGMFAFNENFFELTAVFENGNIKISARDSFDDIDSARFFEGRISRYILKRIDQEILWMGQERKFGPKYLRGKPYLRRRKGSQKVHQINLRRAANSHVNKNFATRLTEYNLCLVFKPAL